MSNLEPVEDKDLDLQGKFKEKPEGAEGSAENKKEEKIMFVEKPVERKEGEMEKEKSYSKILSKVKSYTAAADDASVPQDAKDASLQVGAESKIEKLINVAMEKGVPYAVKVARHLENNFVLDEFHDRLLADEFHNALVKKGLIKEL